MKESNRLLKISNIFSLLGTIGIIFLVLALVCWWGGLPNGIVFVIFCLSFIAVMFFSSFYLNFFGQEVERVRKVEIRELNEQIRVLNRQVDTLTADLTKVKSQIIMKEE